jgi:hypothetical protein
MPWRSASTYTGHPALAWDLLIIQLNPLGALKILNQEKIMEKPSSREALSLSKGDVAISILAICKWHMSDNR